MQNLQFSLGSSRRRVRSKFEIEYENDDYTLKLEDAATVNDAGVTTCSCGRSYSKRKNYIRLVSLDSFVRLHFKHPFIF